MRFLKQPRLMLAMRHGWRRAAGLKEFWRLADPTWAVDLLEFEETTVASAA